MTKMSSTMLSVGTLLRRAEETGAPVRVLVEGCWLDGRVIGCDGLGAVLDDDNGQQALVRLDSVAAVTFSRAQLDDETDTGAWHHSHQQRRADRGRSGDQPGVGAGPLDRRLPVRQPSALATTSRASSCTWARCSGPWNDSA